MFIIILDCYAPSFCFLKIKQTEHIHDNRYNGNDIHNQWAPVLYIWAMISPTLHLAGFWRGGKSLNVPMKPPPISWMAVTEKALRSIHQRL